MIPVPNFNGSQLKVVKTFIGDKDFYGPFTFLNKDYTISYIFLVLPKLL